MTVLNNQTITITDEVVAGGLIVDDGLVTLVNDTIDGGLTVQNFGVVEIDNDTQILDAAGDAPGVVLLDDGTIENGKVDISGGLEFGPSGVGTLHDALIVNIGELSIGAAPSAAQTLIADGTLQNSGAIAIGGGNFGALRVGADGLKIDGGGTITLQTGLNSGQIEAQSGAATLENVDDTITGDGDVGDGFLSVENDAGGTIEASGAGQTLTLAPYGLFVNDGLVEAIDGGTLTIGGNRGVWTNAAGATLSASAGGALDLVGPFHNVGQISVVDAELTLGGALTLEDLGALSYDPTTGDLYTNVSLTGTSSIALAGALTLDTADPAIAPASVGVGDTLDATQGLFHSLALANATIAGGTVIASGAGGSLSLTNNTRNTIHDALVVNAGVLSVGDAPGVNATLVLDGVLDNSSQVNVGAGGFDFIDVADDGLKVDGGGTIALGGGAAGIAGAGVPAVLENVDDAIQGAGQVGDGELTIQNDVGGVIDADVTGESLNLAPYDLFANKGLAEATNAATLNVGGVGAGWTNDAGGTLSASGGGVLNLMGPFTNDGDITVTDGTLGLSGPFDNSGTISTTAATIDLAGSLTLNDLGGASYASGSGDAFANFTTANTVAINLAGTLTLDTVDPGITPASVGVGGTLDASQGFFQNLIFENGVIDGGTAIVSGASGALSIANGYAATLHDVLIENTGLLWIGKGDTNQTLTADGVLQNSGTVQIGGGASALRVGADGLKLESQGTISLLPGGFFAQFVSAGAAATLENVDNTIEGTGQVGDANLSVQNDAGGAIDANVNGQLLALAPDGLLTNDGLAEATSGGVLNIGGAGGWTNKSDGTVSASGGGVVNLYGSITNNGTITATDATLSLYGQLVNAGKISTTNATINLDGALTLENLGAVSYSSATGDVISGFSDTDPVAINLDATLTLDTADASITSQSIGVGDTLDATQGVFQNLALQGGEIDGGTLIASGAAGSLSIGPGAASIIHDALIYSDATLWIGAGGASATLIVDGELRNSGVVKIGGGVDYLKVGADGLKLESGGTLTLLSSYDAYVASAGTDAILENVDNSIQGEGQIGDAHLTVVNDASGVIEANVAGQTLTLAPAGLLTNYGLLKATNGGSLVVGGAAGLWSNEAGATLSASGGGVLDLAAPFTNDGSASVGAGGRVEVAGSVTGSGSFTIDGGLLEIQAGVFSNDVSFSGVGGTLKIDAGATLTNAVADFALGDGIDFGGETVTSASVANDVLQVTFAAGGGESLQLVGAAADIAALDFVSDGAGGTEIFGVQGPGVDGLTAGLQGYVVQPYSSVDLTAGAAAVAAGTSSATFLGDDVNYQLLPGKGDADMGGTSVQQFLDASGTLDGLTLSQSSVADASVANTYIELQGYVFLTAGHQYQIALDAADDATVYLDGQELATSNGGGAQSGTITPNANGFQAIDIQYYEGQYSGTLNATLTDLTTGVVQDGLQNIVFHSTGTPVVTVTDAAAVVGGDGQFYLNGAGVKNGQTLLSGVLAAGYGDLAVSVNGSTFTTANGLDVVADASGGATWSLPLDVTDGELITASASAIGPEDAAVTSAAYTLHVKESTSESAISSTDVFSVSGANYTGDDDVTLAGVAEAGDAIVVRDANGVLAGAATAAANGAWSVNVAGLDDDLTYSYVATATDIAGNTASSPVFSFEATDDELNWSALQPYYQPPYIDATDWGLIWSRFESEVGNSVQSLYAAFTQEAQTLAKLGQTPSSVDELITYAVIQASGLNVTLAQSDDLVSSGPGFDLVLSRSYSASFDNRNNLGAFGYGWTFTYGVTATQDQAGDVDINSSNGTEVFTPLANGGFAAQPGDSSTLTLANGAYVLEDSAGDVEKFLANGDLASIADANGDTETVSYGASGFISSVTSSDGQSITFATNAQGRITSATDGEGDTVSYAYDASGQHLLSATGPEGTTTYAYSASDDAYVANALTSVVNQDGVSQSFQYDSQGDLISASSAAATVAYAYPAIGEVQTTDATGATSTLIFDANGNLARTTDPAGNAVSYAYNAADELTQIVTPSGDYTYTYDANGNLTEATDPLGAAVEASYGPNDDLLSSLTDQNGDTTAYGYDSAGNLTSLTYADGSAAQYVYASNGTLSEAIEPSGATLSYTYDSSGDVTGISASDGASDAYVYNSQGELVSATSTSSDGSSYAESFTYNSAGELTSLVTPQGTESYSYDSLGRETQRVEPNGATTDYSYNAGGQLSQLTDGSGDLIAQYSYDAAGQLVGATMGDGAATSYAYDADGNVTSIVTHDATGAVTSSLAYTYDANGWPTTVVSQDGTWTYGYDADGQLTSAVFASVNASIPDQNLTYVYDSAGNRVQTILNGATTNYTTNTLNQYVSANGTTYSYNADGDLVSTTTSAGQTTAYAYNADDRLVSTTGPNGTTTYAYDALGNIVSSSVNGVVSNYVYDPLAIDNSATGPLSAIAQVYNAAGQATATYEYGDGLTAVVDDGGTEYYNADANGNVTSLSGAGGALVDTYSYDPYGGVIAATGSGANPFQFGGAWGVVTQADDLLTMGARQYSPALGRFTTRDPSGILGGVNIYEYAGDAPTYAVDPTGLGDGTYGDIIRQKIDDSIKGALDDVVKQLADAFPLVKLGKDTVDKTNKFGDQVNKDEQVVDAVRAYDGSAQRAGDVYQAVKGAVKLSGNVKKALNAAETGAGAGAQAVQSWNGSFGTGYQAFVQSVIPGPDGDLRNSQNAKALDARKKILDASSNTQAFLDGSQIKNGGSSGRKSRNSGKSKTAKSIADVHMTTFDGLHYDFQAAGEFVLAKSLFPGDTFQVQARMQPFDNGAPVSVMTEIGAKVGDDRVTFAIGRDDTVWIDGEASGLSATNTVINLAGGQLVELSADDFQLTWNTGEQITVTNSGSFLNLSTTLGPLDQPGLVEGLLGPDEGQADDFMLANGTVLQQPLSASQLYGEFADAWRVTDATSLLDYAAGQTTATFTDVNFPTDYVSLNQLPQNLVTQAEQLAAAAGITDPTLQADAALDFLATGDQSFIAASAAAQQSQAVTAATVTDNAPPPNWLGVAATPSVVTQAASGQTALTFEVYLTQAAAIDETVNYTLEYPDLPASLIPHGGNGVYDPPQSLQTLTFGDTPPSGQVTIAAGQTTAEFTIELPEDALGTLPSEQFTVGISDADTQPIFAGTAEVTVLNNQPVPGVVAEPEIADISQGLGALQKVGDDYTLDLGDLAQGANDQVNLSVSNAAADNPTLIENIGDVRYFSAEPSDVLNGAFSVAGGGGVKLTDYAIPELAAGGVDSLLYATIDTSVVGAHSETLDFTPVDSNDTGYSVDLPTQSLTVNFTVLPEAQATINTPLDIDFGNIRQNGAAGQPVSITNAAPAGAAGLDAFIAGATGAAGGQGDVLQLAPGVTVSDGLSVYLNTSTAGPVSGVASIGFQSDTGGGEAVALPEQQIELSGTTYRLASTYIPAIIVHVGDPGTQRLAITNTAANDGYSENLKAEVVGVSGGIGASGATGDIAPQANSQAITLSYSTAAAGEPGDVLIGLQSDGAGIDGFGVTSLNDYAVPVIVDNYAQATFSVAEDFGDFVNFPLTQSGDASTLSLGPFAQGSQPETFLVQVENSAVGPADLLSGDFAFAPDAAFLNQGFGAFSGVSAGEYNTSSVTLETGETGSFSETITLDPTGSNASGYSAALTPQTLTISFSVAPTVTVSVGATSLTNAADTAVVNFQFSDAPVEFSLADVGAVGGSLSDLTGSGTQYSAIFTAAADVSTDDARVSVVAASWTDASGVAGEAGYSNSFSVETACFCPGGRILTDRGEVAIEALRVGDVAIAASGRRRPIVWIGRRRIDILRHPDPAAVWPVRVCAGAFAEGSPSRDLWLSPGHRVACDGVLIPISALINGVSVAQIEQNRVEYMHVELDEHDVLLAEGLPSESYLDCGNRTAFENGGAFVEAHPDFEPKHWAKTCLPLVLEGAPVARTKSRLIARLAARGYSIEHEADAHIVIDGLRVEPLLRSQTRLAFVLAAQGRQITLRSSVFVPSHTVAESSDTRELGLCVGRLQIDGEPISIDSDEDCASGWHESEFAEGIFSHRWTDGRTPLPAGARIVIIDLAGAPHRWRAPDAEILETRGLLVGGRFGRWVRGGLTAS